MNENEKYPVMTPEKLKWEMMNLYGKYKLKQINYTELRERLTSIGPKFVFQGKTQDDCFFTEKDFLDQREQEFIELYIHYTLE